MPVRLSARLALAIPFALAVLAPSIARADQCAINDQAIAEAVELAKQRAQILALCEPCGEKVPSGPYAITNVTTANGEVMIEGRMVDLAYTYILVGKNTYKNLGLLAGARPSGVEELTDTPPARARPGRQRARADRRARPVTCRVCAGKATTSREGTVTVSAWYLTPRARTPGQSH